MAKLQNTASLNKYLLKVVDMAAEMQLPGCKKHCIQVFKKVFHEKHVGIAEEEEDEQLQFLGQAAD